MIQMKNVIGEKEVSAGQETRMRLRFPKTEPKKWKCAM
jgi:hypothetical protein